MKVLITGGTGSFGQAFVKRLLEDENVSRIVVYSRDELKQSEMAVRLRSDPKLRFFIGDVRDLARLRRALHGIDTIVHAAALKQIPAAEYNPQECIKTNIGGAENVTEAALDCGVKKVVGLSTDKAVHPVNLYGATKLAAEKLFVAANNLSGRDGPCFSVVRYGNVIGSRGSVIPFFRSLAETGELPITDLRMTRFLITLDQGVDLVLKAIKEAKGGDIFVPKLPSATVTQIADYVAPNCAYKVVGIRPGEKIDEVLIGSEESRHAREFVDYYVIDMLSRWSTGRQVKQGFEYSSADAAPADLDKLLAA